MKKIIFLAILLASITPAMAGTITVVGDVNTDNGNNQFYLNVLGDSQNVLFGRGNMFGVEGILSLYSSQGGVSVTDSNVTLNSSSLSGVDLLVFNQIDSWNIPMSYSSSELSAISNFLSNGGDLLLVAETSNNNYANFNTFLSGVGSSIRYDGVRRSASVIVQPHSLTSNVNSFSQAAHNLLTGGSALVVDSEGGSMVSTETVGSVGNPVPEPSVWMLLAMGMVLMWKRRA